MQSASRPLTSGPISAPMPNSTQDRAPTARPRPSRDKVDEENHVRHEPDRVQPILDIECEEGRGVSLGARTGLARLAKLLARPAAPGGDCQQQCDDAEPEPGFF